MSRSGFWMALLLAGVIVPLCWRSEPGPAAPQFSTSPMNPGGGQLVFPEQAVYSQAAFPLANSPARLETTPANPFQLASAKTGIGQDSTYPNFVMGTAPSGSGALAGFPTGAEAAPPRTQPATTSWPPGAPFGYGPEGGGETTVFGGGPPNGLPVFVNQQPYSFQNVFRFDLRPDSIRQGWDRVSTTPGGSGMQGFRVPLVTGVGLGDLHGALTYYFDNNQQLERIQFRGWTGDARPVVEYLKTGFGFQERVAGDPRCFVARRASWFGSNVTSALLLQDPPVVRRENSNRRIWIQLELNRPDGGSPLSPAFEKLISEVTEPPVAPEY